MAADLRRYLAAVRRWGWPILLCPVIATMAAVAVSAVLPPIYQARVTVLVRPAQPLGVDPGVASLTSDQITRTYAQLMTERPLLERVISDLHLHMSPEQLNKEVSVTPDPNTTLLRLSVEDRDPTLARDIANQLVNDYIDEIHSIQSKEQANPNARSADNLVVVSAAVKPDHPVSPNLPLNVALAAGTGLILGLALVFLFEYLDQTIRSDEELLARTGLVALGHIGFTPTKAGARNELVVSAMADKPVAESYKALRTNLLFSSLDREIRSIVITSAVQGEGKSRTAANLAAVLAQAGHSTILIDADFRRPSQHRIFSKVRNVGLANLVIEDLPEQELITAIQEVPGLFLMPSGPTPPNPSELLGSARMRMVLDRLCQSYRYVVVDTPPINVVTDASVLAARADGTILVVEQKSTGYPALKHAKHALERVDGHLLGVVINKLRATGGAYYSDYYYSYAYRDYSYKPNGPGASKDAREKVAAGPPNPTRP